MLKKFTSFLIIILSACSTITQVAINNSTLPQSTTARQQQMSELNSWKIKGKIAFLHNKERQSATLHWQKDNANKTETINLSTIFGINILKISQHNANITLEVDDKQYQTENLTQLIQELTSLNLPTEAIKHWLKGIAYLPTDTIEYHITTNLPETLTSQYNKQIWHITYGKYQWYDNHQLATRFTIKQGDLTIKIVIYSWQV